MEIWILSCAFSEEQDSESSEKNDQVEPKREIFDVEKVVLQFFTGLILIRSVPLHCLCPTGDTRMDRVTKAVMRNDVGESNSKLKLLWPGPNDAHVTLKNIPELRDFIESGSAEEPSCPRNPGIIFLSKSRGLTTRQSIHAPKLIQNEVFVVISSSFLSKQNRTWAIELNQNGNN